MGSKADKTFPIIETLRFVPCNIVMNFSKVNQLLLSGTFVSIDVFILKNFKIREAAL